MKDVAGFCGLALSLVGHAMLTRGNRTGWVLRLAGGCFWTAFAFLSWSHPLMATSAVYMSLDTYGCLRAFRRMS